MLVVLLDSQTLNPDIICHNCLYANQQGQPRWRNGQLCCGHSIRKTNNQQAEQFECEMGFRLVNVH